MTQAVDQFVLKLKRKYAPIHAHFGRQITGAHAIAIETAIFLRNFISMQSCSNAAVLIERIKEVAREIIRAQPLEFVIGNVVRRVLHLIREEYRTISKSGGVESPSPLKMSNSEVAESSMYNMLAHPNYTNPVDYNRDLFELSQTIPQGIQEIMDEIDSSRANIAAQSLEHIHSNEIIMTLGRSEAVEQFLLAAARKRQYQVIIAEAAPRCTGHLLAKSLAKAGIDTLLIPDAAIFAMMGRVNKVIIGCHAVTANGGLIGMSGAHSLTAAAKHHSTPVCVLVPMYKMSPVFPENYDSFNLLANPDKIYPFGENETCPEVLNPLYDYVQPQAASLLITNTGGHPPSYVYRLLGELYDQADYKLD